MKKILPLLLMIVVSINFVGCTVKDSSNLRILVPSGTPSIIVSNMMIGSKDEYQFVYGADPLVAAFTSQSHDIIFAPTNLGTMMYMNNQNYMLGAVVVWGNNFVVSRHDLNISSISDLKEQTIYAFGQNQTPDIILQTIISFHEVQNQIEINYENDATTLATKFRLGEVDIALLAEPSISQLKQSIDVNVIDLQEEWKTIFDNEGYPQVGVFIRSKLVEDNIQLVTDYLCQLNSEMERMIRETDQFAETATKSHDSLSILGKDVIKQAIQSTAYKFQLASDAKVDCLHYFTIILNSRPNLIGGELPNESFFIQE